MADSETCGNCRFYVHQKRYPQLGICLVLQNDSSAVFCGVCSIESCDHFRPVEKPKEKSDA